MAECAELVRLAGLYVLDDLSGAERARVEAHLGAHPDCARYVREARMALTALPLVMPTTEELDAILRATRAAIRPTGPAHRRRLWLAATGAALILSAGAAYLCLRPQATRQVVRQQEAPKTVPLRPPEAGDRTPGFTVWCRPTQLWTMESIAAASEVIVAAEVVEVAEVRKIAAGETRWRLPLLEMSATLRVLRVWRGTRDAQLGTGDVIRLPYRVIDPEYHSWVINGSRLPHLSAGEVFAFPLREAPAGSDHDWELLAEEARDLLVPCATEKPDLGRADTGAAFLRSELAAAFANGRDQDICRAARYLRLTGWTEWTRNPDGLYQLVAAAVKNNEDRWLSIGVICYCATPKASQATLQDLLATGTAAPSRHRLLDLAARALRHVPRQDFDRRFIAEAFRQATLDPLGVARALALNYADHPTARRLLSEALESESPEAVTIALYLIAGQADPLAPAAVRAGQGDPLVPAAVRAACQVLLRPEATKLFLLSPPWQLLDFYGDESDLAPVLEKMRTWQQSDRARYARLYQSSCASARWRIPIARIVIEDRGILPGGSIFAGGGVSAGDVRFCDDAVLGLQIVTGEDFGLAVPLPQSLAERDAAVNRAKAWLKSRSARQG